MNRVSIHLVDHLGALELSSFRRDQLQDVLDEMTQAGLSFSTVDHLRGDTKQIFDMAVAEGLVARNPALLLFKPKEAAKPVRRVMNFKEVQLRL
jgi:site-specific recombinase XerD